MSDATLVDTNVLLDVLTDDPVWAPWSTAALRKAADRGRLIVNQIVYAEVSARFESIEELDAALPDHYFVREGLPWPAGFIAGKAFLRYRRLGGRRTAPFADFYIGAHAAVAGYRLLSRDRGRYATYFPTVELITP